MLGAPKLMRWGVESHPLLFCHAFTRRSSAMASVNENVCDACHTVPRGGGVCFNHRNFNAEEGTMARLASTVGWSFSRWFRRRRDGHRWHETENCGVH